MAGEEQRTVVRAECRAGLHDGEDDDDDDEADFDPNFDDESSEDDDGDEDEDEQDGEESKEDEGDHAILTGTIHLSDEGRVIYSGNWCLRSQLEMEDAEAASAAAPAGVDTQLRYPQQRSPTKRASGSRRRRHPKFKLRSQEVCHPPGGAVGSGSERGEIPPKYGGGGKDNKRRPARTALFDPRRPTLSSEPNGDASAIAGAPPPRRTMVFDGFFFEAADEDLLQESGREEKGTHKSDGHHRHHHHSHWKKIRERDVEIFFSVVGNDDDGDDDSDHYDEKKNGNVEKKRQPDFRIAGRGYNDFGPFVLEGTYEPPLPTPSSPTPSTTIDGAGEEEQVGGEKVPPPPMATAVCRKRYGSGGHAKKRTRTSSSAAVAPLSPSKGQQWQSGKGCNREGVRHYNRGKDEDIDDLADEKADFSELVVLTEEAGLPIEELRRRYYGMGGENSMGDGGGKMKTKTPGDKGKGLDNDGNENNGGGKLPATKKPRLEEESDDDGCGF